MHPTQLNGPCAVHCIIWSKVSAYRTFLKEDTLLWFKWKERTLTLKLVMRIIQNFMIDLNRKSKIKKNWVGRKIREKRSFFDWSIIDILLMIERCFFKYDRLSIFYLQSIVDSLSNCDFQTIKLFRPDKLALLLIICLVRGRKQGPYRWKVLSMLTLLTHWPWIQHGIVEIHYEVYECWVLAMDAKLVCITTPWKERLSWLLILTIGKDDDDDDGEMKW